MQTHVCRTPLITSLLSPALRRIISPDRRTPDLQTQLNADITHKDAALATTTRHEARNSALRVCSRVPPAVRSPALAVQIPFGPKPAQSRTQNHARDLKFAIASGATRLDDHHEPVTRSGLIVAVIDNVRIRDVLLGRANRDCAGHVVHNDRTTEVKLDARRTVQGIRRSTCDVAHLAR